MKFCTYCGTPLNNPNANFCEACGAPTYNSNYTNNNYNNNQTNNSIKVDEGNTIGWGILGFFIPLAGLILWLVWLNERPKSSKSAGLGALIRVIFSFVAAFVILVAFIVTRTSTEKIDNNSWREPTESRDIYYEDDWV